jgi:hypothetical protein
MARPKTREYSSWEHMIQRCRNENNDSFANYGGRGITVCDRWLRFQNFLDDMGERPDDMTLDRIDVNGNYEPTNCRWATLSEQSINTRVRKDNKTGYKGVYEEKRPRYRDKKWYVEVKRDGRKQYLGHFASPVEAHIVRQSFLEIV